MCNFSTEYINAEASKCLTNFSICQVQNLCKFGNDLLKKKIGKFHAVFFIRILLKWIFGFVVNFNVNRIEFSLLFSAIQCRYADSVCAGNDFDRLHVYIYTTHKNIYIQRKRISASKMKTHRFDIFKRQRNRSVVLQGHPESGFIFLNVSHLRIYSFGCVCVCILFSHNPSISLSVALSEISISNLWSSF